MNRFLARHGIVLLFAFCGTGSPFAAADDAQQFQSDNPDLALLGIWSISNSNSTFFSVGLKNTGTASIRAFRATILKRNDFDEKEKVMPLEFSSESEYRGNGRPESGHILRPGEAIFFNQILVTNERTMSFYSPVPQIPPALHAKTMKEAKEILHEVLTDKRFLLAVGPVKEEKNDLVADPKNEPSKEPAPDLAQTPPPVSSEAERQSSIAGLSGAIPAAGTPKNGIVVGVADGDFLNVRSAPAMNASAVFKLSNGQKVQIRGRSVFNGDTEWIPIIVGSEQGWVRNKYLRSDAD